MAQMGLRSIEPPEAMAALEQLLAGPLDRVAFLKTTKESVTQSLGVSAQRTLEVVSEVPEVSIAEPSTAVALPEESG
jgi:hypothetical protein